MRWLFERLRPLMEAGGYLFFLLVLLFMLDRSDEEIREILPLTLAFLALIKACSSDSK